MAESEFVSVPCAVLTVSDTRTLETDESGAEIVSALSGAGHEVRARRIVSDDVSQIRRELSSFIEDSQIRVVITTGGTGVTRRDVTPDALEPLITKMIPGFGELFRMLSYEAIGASTIQSRAVGGICKQTLVFALPGSTGAARLALEKILLPQLDARTKPCNFVVLLERL